MCAMWSRTALAPDARPLMFESDGPVPALDVAQLTPKLVGPMNDMAAELDLTSGEREAIFYGNGWSFYGLAQNVDEQKREYLAQCIAGS